MARSPRPLSDMSEEMMTDEEKAERAMERDRTGDALRDGYTVVSYDANRPGPGGLIARPRFGPRWDFDD